MLGFWPISKKTKFNIIIQWLLHIINLLFPQGYWNTKANKTIMKNKENWVAERSTLAKIESEGIYSSHARPGLILRQMTYGF